MTISLTHYLIDPADAAASEGCETSGRAATDVARSEEGDEDDRSQAGARAVRGAVVAFAVALTGCVEDAPRKNADHTIGRVDLQNCGWLDSSLGFSSAAVYPAVDEGAGIVSIFFNYANDTLGESRGINFLDCNASTSVRVSREQQYWTGENFETLRASLANVEPRLAGSENLTIGAIRSAANRNGFATRTEAITADSDNSVCACQRFYPDSKAAQVIVKARPN